MNPNWQLTCHILVQTTMFIIPFNCTHNYEILIFCFVFNKPIRFFVLRSPCFIFITTPSQVLQWLPSKLSFRKDTIRLNPTLISYNSGTRLKITMKIHHFGSKMPNYFKMFSINLHFFILFYCMYTIFRLFRC